MKTKLTSAILGLLLVTASGLLADEAPKAKTGSPEFERMKTLVGTWQGTADMGQGPVEMKVEYRLLAGGTVLEERAFPGAPHEMVTMFYDKDGKLALTHYCVMGNRPAMALKSAEGNKLTFDFDSCCGIDTKKESHMHAMTLRFDDADTLTAGCKAIINGEEVPEHLTTLKRVKAETAAR